MMVATAIPKPLTNNVIELSFINGKLSKKPEVRYNKDGSIDKRNPSGYAGVSKEVYAFNTMEEIKAMIGLFDKHIDEAPDENKKQIAKRNKMMFLIGINLGIRASDLCSLKWSFFFDKDGKFKDFYTLQPKKTRKKGKFVKLYFNNTVKKAITDYVQEYPIEDMEDYLFKSRKGDKSITETSLGRIIKSAAKEIGIEKNICSHSLRKTFGFWAWHNAEDKNKALVTLQMIFNHSDSRVTLRYIGLLNDEVSDVFNSLDLGLDYL